MPRSIEAFSLILLESLRSLKASLVNADTRLLKVDLLPAHRSPSSSPPTSRDVCRCRFIRIPFLILIISLFSLSKGYFQSVAINSRKCTTLVFSPRFISHRDSPPSFPSILIGSSFLLIARYFCGQKIDIISIDKRNWIFIFYRTGRNYKRTKSSLCDLETLRSLRATIIFLLYV